MLRKLLIFLAILIIVLAAGWYAMRRADIPYTTLERAYANDASQFTTLADGIKIHYRDEGVRDAPALVLVHGFSASLHTWEGWVSDLSKDYRVISLDLPGHGLSRAPSNYPVGIDQYVKTINEITDYLGADQFTLVGSSMGGATAWAFAQDRPKKLQGLVLISASGWPPTAEQEKAKPIIFKLMANSLARRLMKDLDMSMLIRGGLEDSFVDQSFVTDEMVVRYSSMSLAPGHRESTLRLMTDPSARRIATPETMAEITAPTLVLQGDQDNLVPVESGRKFGETIPGAQTIIYENVGHLPHEEVTEQSLADLRAFLETRVWPVNDTPDNTQPEAGVIEQ